MIVYKYLAPERVNILQEGRIRFTQPAALNDPFETYPDTTAFSKKMLDVQIAETEKELKRPLTPAEIDEFAKILNQQAAGLPALFSTRFAILSLTKQENNLLMWSHYADSYRGFVLGFDSESDFFKHESGRKSGGLREVVYSDKRWSLPPEGFTKSTDDEMKEANTSLFFHKSDEWDYEEELRVLAQPSSADTILTVADGYDICLFNFPSDCIKKIIFGSRMTIVQKTTFANIAANKYPDAVLYEASLDPKLFQLKITEYLP